MKIFVSECLGTLLLILLGDGVVANVLLNKSKGQNAGWIVIAAGWGFAVMVGVFVSGWSSGAHLNPAVTFGMALQGQTKWGLVPYYLAGQALGSTLGAVLVWLAYLPHWRITADPVNKLLCFATLPAIRRPSANFLCEMIATSVLLIGVLGIFNVHNDTSLTAGAVAVGFLVFGIGLSLGGPTGYAINPARDFFPRLVHFLLPIPGKGSSHWRYAWIPVCAPLLGAALGAWIYHIFAKLLVV